MTSLVRGDGRINKSSLETTRGHELNFAGIEHPSAAIPSDLPPIDGPLSTSHANEVFDTRSVTLQTRCSTAARELSRGMEAVRTLEERVARVEGGTGGRVDVETQPVALAHAAEQRPSARRTPPSADSRAAGAHCATGSQGLRRRPLGRGRHLNLLSLPLQGGDVTEERPDLSDRAPSRRPRLSSRRGSTEARRPSAAGPNDSAIRLDGDGPGSPSEHLAVRRVADAGAPDAGRRTHRAQRPAPAPTAPLPRDRHAPQRALPRRTPRVSSGTRRPTRGGHAPASRSRRPRAVVPGPVARRGAPA